MEFLLGNPFTSPVGQRIDKATDGSLQSEDWGLNIEICDIINETDEGPKDAIKALKKRIVGNKNFNEVMLSLTLLEACVKNCGHRVHVLVSSREFVEGVLVKTILPKNNPPAAVQDKVLSLIQAWADAFRSSPDLTGVVSVYEDLRRKGLEFPMTDLDSLSPIHTPHRSVPDSDPAVRHQGSVRGLTAPPAVPNDTAWALPPPIAEQRAAPPPDSNPDGPIALSAEQLSKLCTEMQVVRGNVTVMSEMLAEMSCGQVETSDLELLQELNRTCCSMQRRVLELIPRVGNEGLTEELLLINDDMNNVFMRYERMKRRGGGEERDREVSDSTPDTPALIQSAAGSTVSAPPVGQSAVSSLSSQLASLNMGSSPVSVSSTLQTLATAPGASKPVEEDEFDMFAQTRSSSLADQRKQVRYEDPQAVEGLAGALDTRLQNTGADDIDSKPQPGPEGAPFSHWMVNQGMIPVSQSHIMDDIEQWLSVDVVREQIEEEGVTSEEFDKFLEERAKAADRLPSSPSATPPSQASRRRQESTEETLFAL
ncbi:target of Myb protein 1-like isoform X2 [Polyodon spathula]|uniref:target of Myb protein 1-like isoform X2 n=1 Tax=Polyodon spathula TaxID=7913 RepID=UPI001B7E75B8|nr:target of Myb protein 1-like isoform X2 [Polyodon spathula]